MLSAVLDSVVLVSALLTSGGVTADLVRQARNGAFVCCLSDEILGETQRVLLVTPRLRERYIYSDEDVQAFILSLREATVLTSNLPPLSGIVRDPNDDMVIACASAASADYILLPSDPAVPLDMGQALHTAYERTRYDLQIDYRQPSVPPLSAADAEWASERIRAARSRTSP